MRRAIIVTGLGYGDEGKGTTVDWISQTVNVDLVVLYCGGYQAAHRVVAFDGTTHIFSQIGAATMSGARTFISGNRVISPYALKNELWTLANSLGNVTVSELHKKITIHPKALVATPFLVHLNRIQELHREEKHGSCGMGIWETRVHASLRPEDAILAEDLPHSDILKRKLVNQWEYVCDICDKLKLMRPVYTVADAMNNIVVYDWVTGDMPDSDIAVFEGTQGIMLDPDVGVMPHVTGSCVMPDLARELIPKGTRCLTVGVARRYPTRHGAGPFETETHIAGFVDPCNPYNTWQGEIRVGWPNFDELNRAAILAKVDLVAVNHYDMERDGINTCCYYDGRFQNIDDPVAMQYMFACRKGILFTGHGPAACDKRPSLDGLKAVIGGNLDKVIE